MAMTEKQIIRRMNEAYEIKYGEAVEDEWYGEDSPEIWRFHRPSKKLEVKMVLEQQNKRVNCYEIQNPNKIILEEDWKYRGSYSW